MPVKIVALTLRTRRYWFLKQSTLWEILAMSCKILHPLTSYLVYPSILILDAINPGRGISYAMQNCVPSYQLSCVLVPEAINPERAIRYAMQNRAPTYKYPVILVRYKTARKSWREILSASASGQRVGRQWAGSGHAKNPLTCQCLSAHILRWRGLEHPQSVCQE